MTLASAHRGDAARFRENTLLAIQSAIINGAPIVEIDVRRSADGTVIVLHDRTLERLWGYEFEASDAEWPVIAGLGWGEVRIPRLLDVLELFRGSASTLMVDMDTIDMADAAFDIVEASGVEVVWCGEYEAMQRIRARAANARIWMPWNRSVAPTQAELSALTPEVINVPYWVATQQFVADVHALGLAVCAWTIDDEPTMRWAKHLGIDYVTSNRLELLQRVLSTDVTAVGDPVDVDRSLEVALVLGTWAAKVVREAPIRQHLTKQHAADIVTDIDRLIEIHIRELIAANLPGHRVIGEEFGGESTIGAPCWYIDPIDGTTNFANHLPWNSVSIALAVDDQPVLGVVADPWRHDLYWAVTGKGAWCNGERLHQRESTSDSDPLAGRVLLLELAAHQVWPGMADLMTRLGERFCTPRVLGSGTLALLSAAIGRGAGSIIHEFHALDHLAATVIAVEAGAKVLDSQGRDSRFPGSGGILIATPSAADDLYQLWSDAVAANTVPRET